MSTESILQLIGRVLRETGGYLTMPDGADGELVVLSRQDWEELKREAGEVQLVLPTQRSQAGSTAGANTTVDDVLERINREIALYYFQQQEAEEAVAAAEEDENERDYQGAQRVQEDEVGGENENSLAPAPSPSGRRESTSFKPPVRPPGVGNHLRRVRFEPLRGDLSPDLQE